MKHKKGETSELQNEGKNFIKNFPKKGIRNGSVTTVSNLIYNQRHKKHNETTIGIPLNW